jgi:hypothetical protein
MLCLQIIPILDAQWRAGDLLKVQEGEVGIRVVLRK